MNITKELLRSIRADMDVALAAVAAKHGIELKCGNARFMALTFTMKVEGKVSGAPPVEELNFVGLAPIYGIDPTWLAKRVSFSGKTFVLRGIKRGGKSVLLENGVGKMFRAPIESFKERAKLNPDQQAW